MSESPKAPEPDWSPKVGRIAAGVALAAVAVITLAGLGSYGIWDPWELTAADLARELLRSGSLDASIPPLGTWLVGQSFRVLGVHEWSGRLPMALMGVLAAATAYLTTARFAGRRAGVIAAIVTGTSPLMLLNAREMLGAAPAFAASGGVFLCAMSAVFRPASLRASSERRRAATLIWLGGLGISAALATMASGALLGVAPPLLAVAVVILARGELLPPYLDRSRTAAAWTVLAVALVAGVGTAVAVYADYASFSYWTGGAPRGGDPPTWEIGIERLFHSFAPWSGLLPLALASMLAGAPRKTPATIRFPEENALRLAVFAWVAFSFLAQTVFAARFGPSLFCGVVGASVAVALFLNDVSRGGRGRWWAALVCALFVGLIIRDYRAYPGGPVEGLGIDGLDVPEEFNPIAIWAIVLGLFALAIGFAFAADPTGEHKGLRRDLGWIAERWRTGGRERAKLLYGVFRLGVPVDVLRQQWGRGIVFRIWLIILVGVVPFVFVAFGATAVLASGWMMESYESLAVRIGQVLLFVPVAVIGLVAAARLTLFGFAKLGAWRIAPALVLGFAVGAFTAFGYQPGLSSHFSPREVYDTYNLLAQPGEPLGEFRVGGRAAAYYADSDDIVELENQVALVDFLRQDRRVWAAFRADDLAGINREYRRRTSEHLFIADARSARMLLATNRPIEGRENGNYLAETVLDEAPPIEHLVRIDFDGRIELLGYNLGLPHDGYVGPGEAFTITWYFRVNAPVPGSYKPFVHIEGPGVRLNGDHDPVDGRYPVRLWESGDVVVDRQEIRVPANYGRGNLTIYMGFYSGDTRLEVLSGPADEVDRARVGTLPVR